MADLYCEPLSWFMHDTYIRTYLRAGNTQTKNFRTSASNVVLFSKSKYTLKYTTMTDRDVACRCLN